METRRREILEHLIRKGVSIPCPETVEISPDLDPTRISGRGVTLHSNCRLPGPKTLILPGVELEGMDRVGDAPPRERFLEGLNGAASRGRGHYLSMIKGLGSNVSETGARWLQGLVDEISEEALHALPGLPFKKG
jgi:hypothetical protein